jgi:hypothetical protein
MATSANAAARVADQVAGAGPGWLAGVEAGPG